MNPLSGHKTYSVVIGSGLDNTIEYLADYFDTDYAGIIRKAILLLKHAADADEVILRWDAKEQKVIL